MIRAAAAPALIACLLAPAAAAREAPNPPGRLVLDPHRVPRAAASFQATAAMPAPLPAGAVQIDSTWYDLQDFGSLGVRIVVTAAGDVHLVYEKDFCELDEGGCPPDPNGPRVFPRGMGYAVRPAAGAWSRVGKVRDAALAGCPQCAGADDHGGFGTLAVLPDGRAAVAQHMNQDGCDLRGDLYVAAGPASPAYKAYLTPISDNLFPQVAALPNGSFTLIGEVPLPGSYEEVQSFQVSRLAAEGGTFTCPTGWQFGPWTNVSPSPAFRDGRPAFPSLATASNGRAGIAVGDFGGNVFLVESSNGTFAAGTVTVRNLTGYSDAAIVAADSTSTQYRPYVHCHLAYRDTTPHVVWSELQARRSGPSSVFYVDHRSRIRHWDSVNGASVVKQVAPGEADTYDHVDLGYAGPISGFNTISVDWPQVGFSPDGSETYVTWLRFVDAEIDATADAGLPGIVTGVGFGDVAGSMRRGGGAWSPAQNLTATPRTDERFAALAARNPGGRFHVVFQASATDQAGCALIGDRGSSPGNLLRRIAYLERPVAGTLVSVTEPGPAPAPLLAAAPNPARGSVRFRLAPEAGLLAAVEVYGVDGRRVAALRAPGGAARWDGRDAGGTRVPSGIYLARVAGRDPRTAVKFLMIH